MRENVLSLLDQNTKLYGEKNSIRQKEINMVGKN